MRYRSVTLPLFGMLAGPDRRASVVDTMLSVPGVSHAQLCPETEVLDLRYDPGRCGPTQLIAAIESFLTRGGGLVGVDRW